KQLEDGKSDPEQLRQGLFDLRRTWAGPETGVQLARLGMRLPSALDRLDPATVPAEARFAGRAKELVAVLGDIRLRHPGKVERVAVAPDGRLAASSGGGLVRLWDVRTLACRGEVKGALLGFRNPGGEPVTDTDRMVRFWDVSQGTPKECKAL